MTRTHEVSSSGKVEPLRLAGSPVSEQHLRACDAARLGMPKVWRDQLCRGIIADGFETAEQARESAIFVLQLLALEFEDRGDGVSGAAAPPEAPTIEQVPLRLAGEQSMRPIGHKSADRDLRQALCGAEIAGIEAFGPHDVCLVCEELAKQYGPGELQ